MYFRNLLKILFSPINLPNNGSLQCIVLVGVRTHACKMSNLGPYLNLDLFWASWQPNVRLILDCVIYIYIYIYIHIYIVYSSIMFTSIQGFRQLITQATVSANYNQNSHECLGRPAVLIRYHQSTGYYDAQYFYTKDRFVSF